MTSGPERLPSLAISIVTAHCAKTSTGTVRSTLCTVWPSGWKLAARTQWPSASTSHTVYIAPDMSGWRSWNTTNALRSAFAGAISVPPEPRH